MDYSWIGQPWLANFVLSSIRSSYNKRQQESADRDDETTCVNKESFDKQKVLEKRGLLKEQQVSDDVLEPTLWQPSRPVQVQMYPLSWCSAWPQIVQHCW